jgi:hypothetical protein
MNTQKHTSGQWIVVDSGASVISKITDERHANICKLADRPLAISPEVEANAKLIAAAPELLAALHKAVNFSCYPGNPEYHFWLNDAMNALQKAE